MFIKEARYGVQRKDIQVSLMLSLLKLWHRE